MDFLSELPEEIVYYNIIKDNMYDMKGLKTLLSYRLTYRKAAQNRMILMLIRDIKKIYGDVLQGIFYRLDDINHINLLKKWNSADLYSVSALYYAIKECMECGYDDVLAEIKVYYDRLPLAQIETYNKKIEIFQNHVSIPCDSNSCSI